MKKEAGVLVAFVFVILFLQIVSASSVDNEIKKLTSYAEDFETGNIDYAKLVIYSSAVRSSMNQILGATNKEMGGILKEEQLKSILGEPTEKTKWVWVENEQREEKMNEEVPAWRKIIFDGKKIQIWLSAWPNIFIKEGKREIIYRLNVETNFKKPEEQLDMNSKISEIKGLAEVFNKNPSNENANLLAQKSVSAEMFFNSFMRQNQGKCEETMNSIFGSENKRESQKTIVQEIEFFTADNFEVKARLEMCDECEWYWINLDFNFEGRGAGFKPIKEESTMVSPKQFEKMSDEEFKKEINNIIQEVKSSLEQKDYKKAMSIKNKIQAINEAWNQKSNNAWQDTDKIFEDKRKAMSQEQMEEYNKNYGWIRDEQEKQQKVREIAKQNYNSRKEFYLNLFSQYKKKEFYFTQEEYEKRLIEEFKEFGKEICNNNQDDNNNNKIDCNDEQCSGKKCGKQKIMKKISEGNETKEVEVEQELYCISNTCQVREEKFEEKREVCGNHICEGKENTENCKEDCNKCKSYGAINCSGKVIFKGKDEFGCMLEPICLEERESCEKDNDCFQPLCGKSLCIEKKCKTTSFEECRKEECSNGEEKIKKCTDNKEIVTDKCIDSIWKKTGFDCEGKEIKPEEPISGNECNVKEDCGNEDDVCSNGKCVTLPKNILPVVLLEETKEETGEQQSQEEQPTEQTITGQVINSLKIITGKITGFVVSLTGYDTNEQQPTEQPAQQEQPSQPAPQQQETPQQPIKSREGNQERANENRQRDEENRMKEEQERRENECNDMCERNCKDSLVMPCVGKCSREENCKDSACVDEAIKKCEDKCKIEKGFNSCIDECKEKCKKGEKFEKEREEEEMKMEKGVFKVGGACRKSGEKTEAFIYFDGWGEPFENLRNYKQQYYNGGQADWCKDEFENLIKQRKEFENSFNEEFVRWFFEKYLANSAEDWEEHVSGIFELYWKDVENSKQIVERMNCLDKNELPEHKLISIKYETEFGKIEFWEELKTTKLPGIEKETQIITPYMKIWIFPPKEFIVYEMKRAMKNHEFPGPAEESIERKNQEGPTEEEKAMIKQDKKFMEKIKKIADKYNGNVKALIQFKENESVVFNLYAEVNENDIVKIIPMLPEEVKESNVKIELDFNDLYEMISTQEKEMRGERLEMPYWEKRVQPVQKVKEIVNGVKMYFKVRSMINSAKISPKEAEKDARELFNTFFKMMMKGKGKGDMQGGPPDKGEEKDMGKEKGAWKDKKIA